MFTQTSVIFHQAAINSFVISILASAALFHAYTVDRPKRWSEERVRDWHRKQSWIFGANFIPSTAVNQLEMWQKDTFDKETIDRELGWMHKYGLNAVRVYLHHMVWHEDRNGFIERMKTFQTLAKKHKLQTIFVFFEDAGDPEPTPGNQLQALPHLHNSRWTQDPGMHAMQRMDYFFHLDTLRNYVKDVISTFKDDEDVLLWDLYNQPGNTNQIRDYTPTSLADEEWKEMKSAKLLRKAFAWAREVHPTQPLTSAVWTEEFLTNPIADLQLRLSDVISFQSPQNLAGFIEIFRQLLSIYQRPVFCTEFLGRTVGSTFEQILPYAQDKCIPVFTKGWVNGKTQTNYDWGSWWDSYMQPPAVWYGDVLHGNGTPYDQTEIELIGKHAKLGCFLHMV